MEAPKLTKAYFCKSYLLLILVFASLNLFAQQKAFPTAVGAGAYVTGGRGGDVYHVTNLNDNGPGSFRDAISQSNRTIVFDISGVINLNSSLNITNVSNITIAGQTAPEGGITIDGERVYFENVNNLIVRYIRFKGGIDSTGYNGGATNSHQQKGNIENVIYDHCTFMFGFFQGGSWRETGDEIVNNLTVQRCLFAHNDRGTISGKSSGSPNAGNYSFVYNMWYNATHRTPNIGGDGARIDVINNVVWYAFNRLMQPAGSIQLNHIGNYYDYNLTEVNDYKLQMYGSNITDLPEIYTNNNKYVAINESSQDFINSISTINLDNKLAFKWFVGQSGTYGGQLPSNYFVDEQHLLNGQSFEILSPDEALNNVSNNVGCNLRLNADGTTSNNLDDLDQEVLNNVINGVYTTSRLPMSNWIVPPLTSVLRQSNFYVSNPHIPEIWYQANVPNGQDHNDIAPSGYTWLEEYLNQVDNVSVGNVEATGLNLSPDVATLNVSDTLNLNVQFIPANTTDQSGVWTSENEEIANVDTNGTVTGIAEGVVEIRFVSNDGGFTDTSVITVVPLPVVADAGEDQNICEGESVLLTATGGTNFLWSTGDSTQSITVSPNSTTTYSVTVSNGSEEDSDEVIVFVDSLPNLTVSEDVTIIEGESTTISANGATEYLWNTGQNTSAITVSPNVTTTYTVTGTNGACEVQAQITVTVEEIFVADAGDDEFICEGSGDVVTLTAGDGDTYLWSTGETTQSINVSPSVTSTYSVTITSGVQEDSDEVTVFVDPNPNVVIVNGDSVDILNGDFITLSATGANSYEWNNGATQPNIAVSPSVTTTYEVRGYINDCYDEKQVTVNVFEPVVAYAGEDISICLNEVATLTATGGDEYLWSTGETTQSIQVSPYQTTEYTVTVFNTMDFDEASVRVEVDAFCEEETSSQNNESSGLSFKIYPNPAYNYINVELDGTVDLTRVFIYDFTGKLVQQTEIQNESQSPIVETRMNIQSLSNGIYFVKLVNKSGDDLTRKLIVR